MLNPSSYFSPNYATARAKFLAAATAAGGAPVAYPHPLKGPEGEDLATDVVRIGPADAHRYIVLNTATHGVEGFCGSGALIGALTERLDRELPPGVAFLMIHAINPHGFAWIRRVTEDNVDLNRNFVDFSQPLPVNNDYAPLHPMLIPEKWDPATLAENEPKLAAERERLTPRGFQSAVSRGQYSHSDGLFFGGKAPTWSNLTLRRVLSEQIGDATDVLFYDFHTGLGPYGTAEPISSHPPDSDGHKRLLSWIGDCVTSAQLGTSNSTRLSGTIGFGVEQALPKARHTRATLEYGTKPNTEVIFALRADAWLHNHADPLVGPQAAEIKALIRDAFYRDFDDWKELVWVRARQLVRRGMAGMAADPV